MNKLEQAAVDLSDLFLPKVDYRNSFLDSASIQALNRFELEVENVRRAHDVSLIKALEEG